LNVTENIKVLEEYPLPDVMNIQLLKSKIKETIFVKFCLK